MNFVNKLELSDQKYQTNGNVRDENYKGKFGFPIEDFVSFGADLQTMYYMSTRFLKDSTDGVCVPQFQLTYIHNTTHPSHTFLVKLCREVHYMWWVNQYF